MDLQVTKLYISPRLTKILNMWDSINCERREQPERLREALKGVQGAGPLAGKFCIWQAKYAWFQALFNPNYKNIWFLVVASLMGQLSFSWENMYFWNHKCTFSVSFLSKFINKYECGGCKGATPPCLRKFCILSAKYMHNFRSFFSLNF